MGVSSVNVIIRNWRCQTLDTERHCGVEGVTDLPPITILDKTGLTSAELL